MYLAGVGKLMTEVAGEVCDGFFFHAFTTPAYLREVTLPALARGRGARPGTTRLDGFTIAGPAFTCVGRTDEELAAAIRGTKEQIAFYASTPAYRGVLEHHGWGDLQPELTRMSKEGKWTEMADVIDDDVVRTFAAVGDVADGRAPAARAVGRRRPACRSTSPYRADERCARSCSPSSVELQLRVVDPLRRELGVEALGDARGTTCDASSSGSRDDDRAARRRRPRAARARAGSAPSSGTPSWSASSCAAARAEELVARAVVAGEPRHVLDHADHLEVDLLAPSPPRAARPAARRAAAW